MLLFYIRHGDPIYNPDSLTELGKRQAEALAKRLSVYGIDKIYASTSNRAYQTAIPTSEITKREINKVEFFNEQHAWDYFSIPDEKGNMSWVESLAEYQRLFVSKEIYNLGDKWYEHPKFKDFKFADGVKYFNEKIDEFMLSLGYEHNREKSTYKAVRKNNDRVAIFAHGGLGGVFLSSLLDIPYPMFISHHSISHTAMTVIEFNDDEDGIIPKVLQFGNDSHIYKEGLPTRHCGMTPV